MGDGGGKRVAGQASQTAMTDRERLLAIMAGERPDRIPWIPRLTIWYAAHAQRGTLPAKYEGWALREIERDLGMGNPARDGRIFRTELREVEVETEEHGVERITRYVTPVGTVSIRERHSPELARGGIATRQQQKHLIQGPDDYPVVEYIIEHTAIVATYDEYLAYEAEVGEDGVPLVSIGADPMYRTLRELIGFNHAFYHLRDYPELVEHLLGVLHDQAALIQQVTLDSPAKLILHGEHFDSQMTPPYLFAEHMVPYFRPFAERLHARGKVLACHADADTSLLLDLIVESGFDMAECFVTAPMVPLTLAEARARLGTDVIIWGGIPSVLLCEPVSDAEFEAYVQQLFRTIAPGDAFILGVADNVMAEAKLSRIERVSEMMQEYGRLPIQL
ncbi:MAG TPA: uroporphyrinogen decarboxylase family protein [Anaerolineae bacterium]|nr:uroporphyrinogen decarboxylase family protein [Anaerolineae bacterium]